VLPRRRARFVALEFILRKLLFVMVNTRFRHFLAITRASRRNPALIAGL